MKKDKKFLFVVLINAVFIVFFIILFEIIIYLHGLRTNDFNLSSYVRNIKRTDFSASIIEKNDENLKFRKPCGLKYTKRPILLYGCSFTYGDGLKEDETFSYVLSEYTKRPVYNFGLSGKGMQHSLYLLQNQQKIEPEPEYIIYTFLNRQIRRLYMNCVFLHSFNFLSYEYKNGKFIPKDDKFKYIKNTMLFQSIMNHIIIPLIPETTKYNLFMTYLTEMKKEITIKYPNAKFILILYDKKYYKKTDEKYIKLTDERIREIKNIGIDVLDFDEIFGDKLYQLEYQISRDDDHPNKKAWKMIVPEIAKIEKM